MFELDLGLPAPKKSPLVVCYGAGVDSTAVLVEFVERGIIPDLILFADTGAEKPETYAYLKTMQNYLAFHNFPPITIVRYQPVRAPYITLEGKQLANESLPSLAFGAHTCSIIFKKDVQEKYIKEWSIAQAAWGRGEQIIRVIGYDYSKADLKRSVKITKKLEAIQAKISLGQALTRGEKPLAKDLEKFTNWFPLQDWKYDRPALMKIIAGAGLPVPMKSACFFCPASKKKEIIWLRDTHPKLFKRALEIEANYLNGKHCTNGLKGSTKGLGRTFAWADLAEGDGSNIKESKISMP